VTNLRHRLTRGVSYMSATASEFHFTGETFSVTARGVWRRPMRTYNARRAARTRLSSTRHDDVLDRSEDMGGDVLDRRDDVLDRRDDVLDRRDDGGDQSPATTTRPNPSLNGRRVRWT
jgi:hypothetical protein